MNETVVPFPTDSVANVRARLAEALPCLTPELRKAGSWVLENSGEVGVSTVRQIADAAGVKPNTLVRLARAIGFAGFDDMIEMNGLPADNPERSPKRIVRSNEQNEVRAESGIR